MHMPCTYIDINTVLLYVHEHVMVLYHAYLVSNRNSSDQNNQNNNWLQILPL